jgi:hypothetical protein
MPKATIGRLWLTDAFEVEPLDFILAALDVTEERSFRIYQGSRQARVRVFAENSPFDMKGHLKSRGYRCLMEATAGQNAGGSKSTTSSTTSGSKSTAGRTPIRPSSG